MGGGSLTATGGSSSGLGIYFCGTSSPENINLTVSNNAIVRANGGIASGDNEDGPVTTDGTGIVFDGDEGTVYGDATLQEDLTIGEGESLDIPNGASLTIPNGTTLTNEGTVTNSGTITNNGTINNSGTLPGNIDGNGTINQAPAITTDSLPNSTVGQFYSQTLAVEGTAPTWSVTDGNLPDGLNLNESTGEISGTPSAPGTFKFTVTAANDLGFASKELSITINPAANVPVESVSLSQTELRLIEGGTETLTATVEPDNATNKDVTWSSDNPSVATVNNGVVTAEAPGTATITVTTKDGSGKSASCSVTVTHGNMVHTPKKDATCTADGNTEYWTCGTCGKIFSDSEGKTEIALSDTVISKLGHSYGEPVWSWSEDGKNCTATFTCTNDASHVEILAATITSKVKTPATCTEKGITEYSASVSFNGNTYADIKEVADIPATGHHYIEGKCSVCGVIEATATVPDTDNSQEGMDNAAASNKALPETSDSTLPLAVVALILGIGAITGIVIALRNMRQ